MYHVDYIDIVEVPVYVIAVFLDTAGELNGHNKYLPLRILNKYPQNPHHQTLQNPDQHNHHPLRVIPRSLTNGSNCLLATPTLACNARSGPSAAQQRHHSLLGPSLQPPVALPHNCC